MDGYSYISIINKGPLIIIRVPVKKVKHKFVNIPKWKSILKALTPIMNTYGLLQKDIRFKFSEIICEPNDECYERFGLAFLGDIKILPKFYLYDWIDDGFVLSRSAIENEG